MDIKWLEYVFYGIGGFVLLLTLIITIVRMVKKRKGAPTKEKKAEEVVVKKGVRYSKDNNITNAEGETNISYVKEDIILQPRKMVTVDKKGPVRPGKYTVLSANENESTFNMRIGLYVKEYKHGQQIVLVEGDEICPTSSTIILR